MKTPDALQTCVVGDIGGTNARFARLAADGSLDQIMTLHGTDYPGPAEALQAYLAQTTGAAPRTAAIGIANPLTGDRVQMTNHTWNFSIEEMRRQLDLEKLEFLNDFTALALSLPHLGDADRRQVGQGNAVPRTAIGVIGPGTGLGVSGMVPAAKGYAFIEGEGGHVTLSGQTDEELAVISAIARSFPHVSAERAISGPGLENLYRALAQVRGIAPRAYEAADISTHATHGTDPLCVATVNMFCALLGTQAANLAVTLGARGGIYIGGGIVPRLGEFFLRSPFRQRFEEKGRFSAYLAAIPTWIITAPYPALIGAAAFLRTS
ncbi:glucokinase [Uliginosibacterium sp. H3]|uniref:Glucokinase n=1 Tax=Uliginosibacterium silvisoli TaxID=3114758 RepID=A0ABU6K3S2_9RHOO|nr:glucokinase [Uliginosibacterium sp. H3]